MEVVWDLKNLLYENFSRDLNQEKITGPFWRKYSSGVSGSGSKYDMKNLAISKTAYFLNTDMFFELFLLKDNKKLWKSLSTALIFTNWSHSYNQHCKPKVPLYPYQLPSWLNIYYRYGIIYFVIIRPSLVNIMFEVL